jgi:cytochrome c oxidase subunit II
MKSMQRRLMIRNATAFAVVGVTGALAVPWARTVLAQSANTPREIEIVAQRFKYEPAEIPLKVGERVVLAIRSLDFIHGFNIPDLGIRTDLVPGKITKVELQPKAAGIIDFLCDNFCGDGHEGMHGRFIISS